MMMEDIVKAQHLKITNQLLEKLKLKIPLSSGLQLEIHNAADWEIMGEIFADQIYDPVLEHIFHEGQAETIEILNLGGNVGFFDLRCRDLARKKGISEDRLRVISVEASPQSFKELQRRIRDVNHLKEAQHTLIHGLVGARVGKGIIHELAYHGMNRVRESDDFNQYSQQSYEVDYIDLTTLVPHKISLLKCDIEGSEEEFLKNYPMILEQTEQLIIEFHPDLCDVNRCKEILLEHRFKNFVSMGQVEWWMKPR